VLLGACALIFVNIANQELLIPALGGIPIIRGDPKQEKARLDAPRNGGSKGSACACCPSIPTTPTRRTTMI
jgi:hypothetical protein